MFIYVSYLFEKCVIIHTNFPFLEKSKSLVKYRNEIIIVKYTKPGLVFLNCTIKEVVEKIKVKKS